MTESMRGLVFLLILAALVSSTVSLGVAKLGHPGALWFWRDMLGVL